MSSLQDFYHITEFDFLILNFICHFIYSYICVFLGIVQVFIATHFNFVDLFVRIFFIVLEFFGEVGDSCFKCLYPRVHLNNSENISMGSVGLWAQIILC